jgi:hypothetical protein
MLVRVSLQITMREVARWNIVTPAPVIVVRGLLFEGVVGFGRWGEVWRWKGWVLVGRKDERRILAYHQAVTGEVFIHG